MSGVKTGAGAEKLYQKAIFGLAMLTLPAFVSGEAHAQQSTDANAQATEEVVVLGHRLSTERAIDAQRSANVVLNVIAADDLGKLPDANVADALARVPGVNVIVNQETGEGEFVTVRGFAGTFNAYSINGVRVANTDTESRRVSLTVLPPNGLQAISVSKTLTPDMDGDAIGGSIDFRTPTAYDFPGEVTRAFFTYGYNDRARTQNEDDDTTGAEIQFGRRFDNDRWGFFAAANYTNAHGLNEETENDGEWEPYKFRLNSEEEIDARSLYLPGIDLDYRRVAQERWGGNFSLDYRPSEETELYLRGQFARFERTSNNDYTDFRTRPSYRLRQANINDTSLLQPENAIVGTGAKGRIYSYTTAQIVDADQDGVITDADRTTRSYWSLYGRTGVWDPQQMQFARTFEIQDQNQILSTINGGGASTFGALRLEYDLSYSYGEKESPDNYSVGYNCDRCGILGSYGVLWSSYDPRFPLPQLAPQVADVERRDDYLQFDGAGWSRSIQSDERIAFRLDAQYDMDSVIDYVKAGVKYMSSSREFDATQVWEGDLLGAAATTLDQSGLVERQVTSMLDGRYYYGSIYSRDAVRQAIQAAQAANPVDYTDADQSQDDRTGEENIYAAYALANFKLNDLEVIAGVRAEFTDISNTAWDGEFENFSTTDSDYSNVLPSVTAIYRPNEHMVFRGALWTSISRPEYQLMFDGQRVTRDPVTDEILAIQLGSPDLKPAESTGLDLTAEYYPDRTSVLSIGAFYKNIDNFIFTNGVYQTADTTEGNIEITQVKNGTTATIAGFELNIVKEFSELAFPFNGLGVSFNLTQQSSEADPGLEYRAGNDISFIGAPDLLYNASISYQQWGFQMLLSYNYQGAYIEDLRDNAVDKWVQPTDTLDFHSRYTFNDHFAVDFDVQNILDGHRYYTTKGDSPSYQKDYMEPGRTFLLKAAFTY